MINNTVIEVLDREHGKKVLEYFKSQDIDTKMYTGNNTKQDGESHRYYGVIGGHFDNYSETHINKCCPKVSVITLPQQLPQRGDRILVWDSKEADAESRIFLVYIEGAGSPVQCVDVRDEDKFTKGHGFDITRWKNWKPVHEEQIVELTMEDISNGKGVGVPPHLIRIKK